MSIIVRTLCTSMRLALCLGLLTFVSGCCCCNGWIMNNSGMGYYEKGNYAMARTEFQRAVYDSPRNPDYRHNLAMATQKVGDVPRAEQILRHNLSVDPMHQPTYHALSQILINQQRTPEAEQLLTEWRDSQPYVPESYLELAWLQREMGNRAAAEQNLRQALQIKPNHPTAMAHLGQLYHETGQPEMAANMYQQSLVSRWNQPQVHSRLSTITGTTSAAINMRRRSALLQNDVPVQTAVMTQGPIGGQTTLVSSSGSVPTPVGQVIALDEPGRRPRRRERRNPNEMTAYSLPDFGSANTSLAQSDVIMSSAPIMAPGITAGPTPIPDMSTAAQPQFAPPTIASGPTLIPQADPAHSAEATAGLPIVDPH